MTPSSLGPGYQRETAHLNPRIPTQGLKSLVKGRKRLGINVNGSTVIQLP